MKVLSNLEFKNSTYILNKFNDFPENPVEGMTIFKENGLYIYSLSQISGQLEWLNILDFTRVNTSFKFEQSSENIEWTINHGLNTQDLFVIVYDSDGNKQIESEIQFQSDNEIKLIFSEAISGKALLFGASVVSSPSNMYTKEEIDELLKNIEVSGGGSNIILPENGTDGQVLVKDSSTESGLNWSDQNKTEYPSNGSNGQVLIYDDTTSTGAKWGIVKNPHKLNVGDVFYTLAENPPSNCLMLDNQTLDKNEYAELYSVIGDSGIISSHKKYIFDEYTYEEQSSRISSITSDLSLGEESYYSAVIDNKIKVSSVGVNGGIYTTGYYPWYVLNTLRRSAYNDPITGGWHTPTNQLGKTFHLDFEFLDGTKFSPYKYCIVVWNGNTSYNYYPTYWELKGWNTETSSWDVLDTYTEGIDEKPVCDETSYSYYKIDSYDNTKFYSKFRLSVVAPSHAIAISRFNIFGTKEGESNIYDIFMLPSASTNELNAKAYIVASSTEVIGDEIYSEEETIIGTWINGKPIYRRTFQGITADTILSQDTNFETLINQYGYFVTGGHQVLFPCVHSNNQLYFRINETTHQLLLYAVGGYVNMPYAATVEYTKTTD